MATSITWPLDLPQSPLIDGYEEEHKKVLIRTSMDAAPAKQRRRFSSIGEDFSSRYLMTDAQRASFKTFFKDILKDGALEFNIPDLDGVTLKLVRFTDETPKYSPATPYWIISLKLEYLP